MTETDRAAIMRLLAWEPRFAESAPPASGWLSKAPPDGTAHLSFVTYAPEVDAFFDAVHREFAHGDYLERMRTLGGLDHPPEWFALASFDAVRTVLFAISRGERFCDGLRLEHCERGTVRRALAQLSTLAEQEKK